MKKQKKPMRSRTAMGLWIFGALLVIWAGAMLVTTWATAELLSHTMMEENQTLMDRMEAEATWVVEDYAAMEPATRDYRLWDTANQGNRWHNTIQGGLFRSVRQPVQTASAIYDGEGNLVEESENGLYFFYQTQETWMDPAKEYQIDGAARTLYDASQITEAALETILGQDWSALRVTGEIADGKIDATKIEYISEEDFRYQFFKNYHDGSYVLSEVIRELVEQGDLSWETLLVSSAWEEDQPVWYSTNAYISYYDPGKPVTIRQGRNDWGYDNIPLGHGTHDNLMAYLKVLAESDYFAYSEKHGDLWDTVQVTGRSIYEDPYEDPVPQYRVLSAVRYSPMNLAISGLLYVYIGSFLLMSLCAYVLWRVLANRLILPVETINNAIESGWKSTSAYGIWQEQRQMDEHYRRTKDSLQGKSNEITRLTTALEFAKEAEQNRRLMTSNLAHELKTPLAVIHSYAEGLKDHIADGKRDQYVHTILSEAERTDAMVLEMLDLSRLEAGKVRLSRDTFSLTDLTLSIFSKLELAMEEKNLQLTLDVPEACAVTADEARISQVIENLASNAVKYTPKNGRIAVTITQRRGRTEFLMANDCDPFTEDALTKVWEPFYRIDESRTDRGTGLGLAIARNIVELHGGKCQVQNTKTGVAFSFTI